MKFYKTTTYKLKRLIPMIMIAGATMMTPACCKHNHDPEQTEDPTQPHHNTTYIWGAGNWDNVWPETTDNVAKSADSLLVDNVILLNDGNSLKGIRTSDLLKLINEIVESTSQKNRYKIHGSGTLNETGIASKQDVQDSVKLAQFGFSFGHVRYLDFQR